MRQEIFKDTLLSFAVTIGYLTAFVLVIVGFVLMAERAIEIESDWRADRHCAQGYYCDPGRGP